MATTTTNTNTASGLEHLCSTEDIFHRHLLPFLSCQDAGRLEGTSRSIHGFLQVDDAWKVLVERDYSFHRPGVKCTAAAPVYSATRKSFDTLEHCKSYKHAYEQWKVWQTWTHGGATAQHMVEAVDVWQRLKRVLEQSELYNVVHSFEPCLEPEVFQSLLTTPTTHQDGTTTISGIPSSLVALYSIHGGQCNLRPRSQDHEFFGGLLGSFSCYHNFYSMRLVNVASFGNSIIFNDGVGNGQYPHILVGMSPGNPRMYLYVHSTCDDAQGEMILVHNAPISHQSIRSRSPVVGRGGFLAYLRAYVERLEAGVYGPAQIIPESPTSRGIGLFPNANLPVLESDDENEALMMSCSVTRGIEVRASARWFPEGIREQQTSEEGLNFGYSVRIQMLDNSEYALMNDDSNATDHDNAYNKRTCQLVGRQWEFTYGDGSVRRVEGDAVIGKQPLFFRDNNTASGRPGYIDLGPAGEGERHTNEVFVYQSQSGPCAGTTQQDTKGAHVKGTFSFVPGSIDQPTGPLFYVTVGMFPLTVPFPFY